MYGYRPFLFTFLIPNNIDFITVYSLKLSKKIPGVPPGIPTYTVYELVQKKDKLFSYFVLFSLSSIN